MAENMMAEIPAGRKVCKGCKNTKELEEFRFDPRSKTRTTGKCKSCLSRDGAVWRKANQDKVKAYREKYAKKFPGRIRAAHVLSRRRIALERREARVLLGLAPLASPDEVLEKAGRHVASNRRAKIKRYGITPEEFEAVFAWQEGKCRICDAELVRGTGGCAIDHDHATGNFRGLLCRLCNVGIGHFRDSVDLLNKAVVYLEGNRTIRSG